MAKIRSNLVLHGLSGMLGNQVVVRRRPDGSFVLAARPARSNRPPTTTQGAQRKKFQDAAAYAKGAMKAAEYQAAAESRHLSAFNVAVADFFNAPEIHAVDLSGYTGEAGQPIVVRATDDVKVTSVGVLIASEGGAFVEKGAATPANDGSWIYTTTKKAPAGPMHIVASAADLAGNIAEQTAAQQ